MTNWTEEMRETLRAGIAAAMSSQEIADQMGLTRQSVRTASKRYNLGQWQRPSALPKVPVPKDFADTVARTTSSRQIQLHYGVSNNMVTRWLAESRLVVNIPPRKPKPERKRPSVTSAEMGRARCPAIIGEPIRDMSTEGRAADYLRRFGPVSRKGSGWLRGSTRLTGAELVERAERLGWAL